MYLISFVYLFEYCCLVAAVSSILKDEERTLYQPFMLKCTVMTTCSLF